MDRKGGLGRASTDITAMGRAATRSGAEVTRFGASAVESAASATRSFQTLTGAVGGTALKLTLLGAGVTVLSDLAKAAVTASQSVWLLPSALAAAGTGFAAVKIGLTNFGDALENVRDTEAFAEALQRLSPNAQSAATALRDLVPAWDTLTRSVQDSLFANVGAQITQLANQYLPQLQTTLSSVAGSINQMLSGVFSTLQNNPEQMTRITGNIKAAFEQAAPAAESFSNALLRIIGAGSDFLPGLAESVANLAERFSNFITAKDESGDLARWIEDGINAAKELATTIADIGKVIYDSFGSAQPEEFKTTLGGVVEAVQNVSTAVNTIADVFKAVGQAVKGSIQLFIINPINSVIEGIKELAKLANKIPGINIDPNAISSITVGTNVIDGTPTAPPGMTAGDAQRQRRGLPPAAGQSASTTVGSAPLPTATPSPSSSGSSGRSGGSANGVEVPYPSTDPRSLIQGYPATASLYSAAQAVLQSQHNLLQQRAELDAVLKDANATEAQRVRERNDVIKAEQDVQEAEMRLQEAKIAATEKNSKQLKSAADSYNDLTAMLDDDLGASRGLAGLADNLVRFVGALATAPAKAMLSEIAKQGDGSSGILGMIFGGPAEQDDEDASPGYSPGSPGYSGYPGDAALLANVPAGRYSQTGAADLTRGIADCSSAVEDLVNLMDGRPTAGRSMSTANAAEWLTQHGFVPGMGGPGDFRVGYNSGHMQATLPGGTNFNWGSDAAAQQRGITGTGADDPAFTSHYYRPMGATPSAITAAPTGSPIASSPMPATSGPVPVVVTNWPASGVPGAPAIPGAPAAPGVPGGVPGAPAIPGGPGAVPGTSAIPGAIGPAPGMPTVPGAAPGTPGTPGTPGATPGTPGAAPMSQSQVGQGASDYQPGEEGWQSQGGGLGIGGGLLGAALQGGMAAGSAMAGPAAPAAAAASQMAMQLINRSIQFGGQLAGIGAEGLFETFSLGDSGLGDLSKSWFGRLLSGLSSAKPAIGGSAGKQDKKAEEKRGEKQDEKGQGQQQNSPGGLTIMGDFVQSPDRNVNQVMNDLNFMAYSSGQPR